MSYATVQDVQAGIIRTLSEREQTVCTTLLERAARMIDATGTEASAALKGDVSCTMVTRAIGSGDQSIPVGATQGSMSALNYSQSWTISNGSVGELYLSKAERKLLGLANRIGSYSPVEELKSGEET